MNYKQRWALDEAAIIKKAGYRVALAESGTYGYFTDQDGTKVISFEIDLLSIHYSGNYKTDNPKSTGSGWRISEGPKTLKYQIDEIFNAVPPRWAIGNAKWRYTTEKEYLDWYNGSSRYTEI